MYYTTVTMVRLWLRCVCDWCVCEHITVTVRSTNPPPSLFESDCKIFWVYLFFGSLQMGEISMFAHPGQQAGYAPGCHAFRCLSVTTRIGNTQPRGCYRHVGIIAISKSWALSYSTTVFMPWVINDNMMWRHFATESVSSSKTHMNKLKLTKVLWPMNKPLTVQSCSISSEAIS